MIRTIGGASWTKLVMYETSGFDWEATREQVNCKTSGSQCAGLTGRFHCSPRVSNLGT